MASAGWLAASEQARTAICCEASRGMVGNVLSSASPNKSHALCLQATAADVTWPLQATSFSSVDVTASTRNTNR